MQVNSINSANRKQNFGKISYGDEVKKDIKSLNNSEQERLTKLEKSQENNKINIIIGTSNWTGGYIANLTSCPFTYCKKGESFIDFVEKICKIADDKAQEKQISDKTI